MSVICKVYVNGVKQLGSSAHLVSANCVAENEVMAAYNPDHEDKLFSKYSPSGTAEFVVCDALMMELPKSELNRPKLYLMFVKQEERPTFAKALCYAPLQVKSVTDFGGTSKQFDFAVPYGKTPPSQYRCLSQFAHRITIDNPGASNQFNPGDKDWWVGVYDASEHTMSEVIEDAHSVSVE